VALHNRTRFREWLGAVRPVLDDLVVAHGGIVLRGFPIADTADFADFIEGFPPFEGGYAGGRAPRATVSGRVMEATRLSSGVRLALHSEMAYRRDYPGRVAFFSRRTAPVGGETLIGDVRNLVDEMDPALVRRIEALGTRTAINFGPKATDQSASYGHMDQRGWNHSFETDDPKKVETLCVERGLQPIWNDDGSLTVLNVLDPFVRHPRTGKKGGACRQGRRPGSQSPRSCWLSLCLHPSLLAAPLDARQPWPGTRVAGASCQAAV